LITRDGGFIGSLRKRLNAEKNDGIRSQFLLVPWRQINEIFLSSKLMADPVIFKFENGMSVKRPDLATNLVFHK